MKRDELKKIFFTLLLCVTVFSAKAQVFPIPSQYFVSPYTVNPAYAGLEGYNYLQLMHKQQWLGIENSPSISNVAIQIPVNRKFNLGSNLFYEENGLLKTTSAMLSSNYVIPFTDTRKLSMGLSGGFFKSQYDVANSSNPDDPAIANFNSTYNPVVSFGIAYYSPVFHIGAALPSLLGNDLVNPEISEKPEEDFYKQVILSTGFKLKTPSGAFSFEPSAIYKMEEGIDDYMEFTGVVNFGESIYVGGSYRPSYGPVALFGFNFGSLRFGYTYDFAGEQVEQFGQGSHEFLVGFRIGKQKTWKTKKPKEKIIPKKYEEPVEPIEEEVEVPEVEEPAPDTVRVEKPREVFKPKPQPQKEERPEVEDKPATPQTYFVVIGAFNDQENATEYMERVRGRGFKNIGQIYNPKSDLTYVYVLKTDDVDEARAMRRVLRNTEDFKETWIYYKDRE